jgi:hypothetical protein
MMASSTQDMREMRERQSIAPTTSVWGQIERIMIDQLSGDVAYAVYSSFEPPNIVRA